jgi:acetylornithine/N-succinyldiaminopimelate aminotransferase
MAVGNAVLDVLLADGFLDEVSRKALLLKQGLAAIADEFPDVIEEIRGAGLMLGVKCKVPNATFNAALREQKLLAVPAGDNVIRLIPALNIADEDIREGLARIRAGAAAISSPAVAG